MKKLLMITIAVLLLSACQLIAGQPPMEVMFYTSHSGHEHFGKIDLVSGVGTDVGPYQNPEVNILRTEWAALSGALYEDAFYNILNLRLPSGATPDEAKSRLVKVNIDTGDVELLGKVIPLNLVALEINHCGEIFAAGFTLSNKLGEWFGDTNLYRVDPESGSLSLIGDTGLVKIMDLAFDPNGTLWATVGNVLYTLDMETGAPTKVVTITGVEKNIDPASGVVNEIMGIGFTSDGILYGTAPFSDAFYRIDPASGVVTKIGRTGFKVPHGGDIPMVPRDSGC